MDLKILPPSNSGLNSILIIGVNPQDAVGSVQARIVKEFFGEDHDEVKDCIVSVFGNSCIDPSMKISAFLELNEDYEKLVTPLDAEDKQLGYSQKRPPRYTLRVKQWKSSVVEAKNSENGSNAAPASNESSKAASDLKAAASKNEGTQSESDQKEERLAVGKLPARRRSRASVLRLVEPVEEPEKCNLDLSSVPPASAPVSFLVGVDGSEGAHLAFNSTMELFNKESGDHIEVLHIFDQNKAYLPFDLQPEYIRQQYEIALLPIPDNQKSVTLFAKPEDTDYESHKLVAHGTKALVCNYANEEDWPDGVTSHRKPDLLVVGFVGRKGPKSDPTILGSCVDYSIRSAACTSLIVKKQPVSSADGVHRFVVGVDGSKSSHHAFSECLRVMDRVVDEVSVVHFYTSNQTAQETARSADLIQQYNAALSEVGCKNGKAQLCEKQIGTSLGRALCDFAYENDCGILCVGADGMKAFIEGNAENHLGSVSDYCVKNSKCCVMVSQINKI